jgi:hypothetical protein
MPECSAHLPAQMRGRPMSGGIATHGFAEGANLLFDAATIFAAPQMSLDLLAVNQVELAIDIGVEKLGHLVVIDIHFE